MKQLFLAFTFFLIFFGLNAQTGKKYALVIHGGAGAIAELNLSPDLQREYEKTLTLALKVGDSVLRNGGTCMDAVEKAIVILEDSPLFNAGRGADLNFDGIAELDASIMEGKTLKAGAVASVRNVKNPIKVTRAVIEKTKHVMLSGAGALQFAKEQGFDIVDNSYFLAEKVKQMEMYPQLHEVQTGKYGTVGCVALDIYGNIAAGTSTGGMKNKKYGRIGDSPIIGAGTYANNATGAFSCTGHGEYFIRLGFARDVSALMEYKNMNITQACREEIKKLTVLGGNGGVIGVDKDGNIAIEFNTSGMFRGFIKSDGSSDVAIFRK